jgi:hypothetical protein
VLLLAVVDQHEAAAEHAVQFRARITHDRQAAAPFGAERSNTVTSRQPTPGRSSTSVDSPPPTSTMAAQRPTPVRSRSRSDTRGRGAHRFTASLP